MPKKKEKNSNQLPNDKSEKWKNFKNKTAKGLKTTLKWALMIGPVFIPAATPISACVSFISQFLSKQLHMEIDEKQISDKLSKETNSISSKLITTEIINHLKTKNKSITILPESIGYLSNLKEMCLDHTLITMLPESFNKLNLYSFRTMDTPLRSLSNINFTTMLDYFMTIANLTPKGKSLLGYWDDNFHIFDDEDMDDHERINRNFEPVSAYYSKSPIQLSIQLCDAPNSLTDEEIERLIWEASPKERELLEVHFPADNEIIQKINERLSIRLNSGSKIRI